MAFALSTFKSTLSGGGAKSALFHVELQFPAILSGSNPSPPATASNPLPIDSKFLISAASIPASTVATYDIFYHGKSIKVAADRIYESTWDTTIINDENFAIRKKIEDWMKLLSNHELNTRDKRVTSVDVNKEGKNAAYKQDLIVRQHSKSGSILESYKFLGAFPTTLSTIALSWESNTIETYTCGWTYDCWKRL